MKPRSLVPSLAAALLLAAMTPPAVVHAQKAAAVPLPGKHRGAVTALVHRGDEILSAGEDGFLGIWNVQTASAVSRFQLTPYRINAMAARPGRDEVCLLESDAMGLYRLSAWNYRERRNLFTIRFRDPITYINYSLGGSFIIAARSGRTALVFIDAETGDLLKPPEPLAGTVGFAVTGRSERNMAVYLSQGTLSYWDLVTGGETNRFTVPANLQRPVLFSNSRCLAGINAAGLQIVDAASGRLLANEPSIPAGALICPAGEELICLVQTSQSPELHRFAVDRNGRLLDRFRVSLDITGSAIATDADSGEDQGETISVIAAASLAGGGIALGTTTGGILLPATDGRVQTMAYHEPARIVEAAVSGASIAFITHNGSLGFIPLDYTRLAAGQTLTVEPNAAYTRISPVPSRPDAAGTFLFWQDQHTRIPPVIRRAGVGIPPQELGGLSFRSPARFVEASEGTVLLLDSAGNLQTVPVNPAQGKRFTFFSVGIMDAAFIDRDRILIGRSAVAGNTPFLIINTATGETVPLPYPSQAGVMVYKGQSGGIYGATVEAASGTEAEAEAGGIRTVILRIDTETPAQSVRLLEWPGEETVFSFAESQGSVAATIGGEGAAIFTPEGSLPFERSGGLPVGIYDGGRFFVSLDADGSLCWHDNRTGKLLAEFRLYPDAWLLQRGQSAVQGAITVKN